MAVFNNINIKSMNLNINIINYEYIFTGVHLPQESFIFENLMKTHECMMLLQVLEHVTVLPLMG